MVAWDPETGGLYDSWREPRPRAKLKRVALKVFIIILFIIIACNIALIQTLIAVQHEL